MVIDRSELNLNQCQSTQASGFPCNAYLLITVSDHMLRKEKYSCTTQNQEYSEKNARDSHVASSLDSV